MNVFSCIYRMIASLLGIQNKYPRKPGKFLKAKLVLDNFDAVNAEIEGLFTGTKEV